MASDGPSEVSREQEIADPNACRPHFVLLGAGASKAAIPNGDAHGMDVPLLRDIAAELGLEEEFPEDLQELATADFEAAYSRLHERDRSQADVIERAVAGYFKRLRLPPKANLYDALLLSLRKKDAIFTFNWDPFLFISRVRLNKFGLNERLPSIFYLHGNVVAAYCERDDVWGYTNGTCSVCGNPFTPTRLLFPVEQKDYNSDPAIKRAWEIAQDFLKETFWLTVFGYSAPVTDIEAVDLLRQGWGRPQEREMEQTEIIDRAGADEETLRSRWAAFIHTHHYECHDSFYDSWLGQHPRRSGEAYRSQYWEAKFIDANPIPSEITDLEELVAWFRPLIDAEIAAGVN